MPNMGTGNALVESIDGRGLFVDADRSVHRKCAVSPAGLWRASMASAATTAAG
jgi:hypothetical protein